MACFSTVDRRTHLIRSALLGHKQLYLHTHPPEEVQSPTALDILHLGSAFDFLETVGDYTTLVDHVTPKVHTAWISYHSEIRTRLRLNLDQCGDVH